MTLELPRFVIAKRLASGRIGYYFNVRSKLRKAGCNVPNEPLGTDYTIACGIDGKGGRAATLNGLVDEWEAARKGQPISSEAAPRIGTVDWLFREYKKSNAYLEKVSLRSRPDYERVMTMVADVVTKSGDRIGSRPVKTVTPAAADKIYAIVITGKKGERLRQAEKAVKLCSKAWRVVQRLHPREFAKDVADPWAGVTLKRRIKRAKGAVTREQVYEFAWGCVEQLKTDDAIAAAAAAVICFEWLQRPENVITGYIRWADYRTDGPTIRIEHHKTGKQVLHPLEEKTKAGVVKFYEEAEEIISMLPRLGIPMIMRKPDDEDGTAKPYSISGFQKIIQRTRKTLKMPTTFTLDACRHGGMTELEEAELTDGQGRALSAHTSNAYNGYAKRTMKRALAATRKRHAHVLAGTAPEDDGGDRKAS